MLRLLLHDTLSPLNALSLGLEEVGDCLEEWREYRRHIMRLRHKLKKAIREEE